MSKKNNLFTPVKIKDQEVKIQTTAKVMTMGSCFSDHIGNLLSLYKFDCIVNPFGTVFNPVSISKAMERVVDQKLIANEEIHAEKNRYFHFDYHSTFNASSPEQVADKLNDQISKLQFKLKSIDYLIITFGTSIVYQRTSNGNIVSNCHKVPSNQFTKTTLSVDFMLSQMKKCLQRVRESNPDLNIILTVSPVRHTKEGLIQNNLSKSRLVDLCHLLTEQKGVTYFPAFEIMMDELRDYRFYNKDLIHPNELAIDIIWDRFKDVYFHENANQKVLDIGTLLAAQSHKPFDEKSIEHITFKKQQLDKIRNLKKKYPEVDFTDFDSYFET